MRGNHVEQETVGSVLYSENQQLRRRLKAFLSQARSNEQKMHRFQEQELQLIRLNSFVQLAHTIIYDYRTAFDLDAVTLTLIDPTYELQHILEDEGIVLAEHPGLIFLTQDTVLEEFYGITAEPKLGAYRQGDHEFLFPEVEALLSSIALLPPERANLPPSPGRHSTLQMAVPSGMWARVVTLPGRRLTFSPNAIF